MTRIGLERMKEDIEKTVRPNQVFTTTSLYLYEIYKFLQVNKESFNKDSNLHGINTIP